MPARSIGSGSGARRFPHYRREAESGAQSKGFAVKKPLTRQATRAAVLQALASQAKSLASSRDPRQTVVTGVSQIPQFL